ncbi:hypothetical protein ACTOB_003942 [Actinoplanes oblitus]|uniref:Polyketide antibiotic transporter n=1 Tax=Actinoplanes oblitus TaxID=3040509 RepID=A0ABY8WTC4_9ACTN|nr:hypothetical protein [Actinoplanes oblitus]WIN00247.1 hypothetical protein ACTOB_003942 [Actinoplanes oblitus]
MTATTPPTVRPGPALTRLALRQARRGAVIVLIVSAGMHAMVAATFAGVAADPAAAAALRGIAGNPAIRTLFGEPVALGQAGGFTVWRVGTVIAVLLGVWAILATTRLTRGAEEAGRWDLLLAGRTSARAITARHLAVVAAATVAVGLAVAAALTVAAHRPAGALVHGGGLAAFGLFCVASAALAAQLFGSRAAATGASIAVLGAGLLLRMIGDGVDGLGRLRWLSPFGLLELSSPYGQNRPLPLLVLLAGAAMLAGLAGVAAGRRDTGDGLLARSSGRDRNRGLLGGIAAFSVRRLLPALGGWAAALAAYFSLIGLTAVSIIDFMTANTTITDLAGQAGFARLDRLDGLAATIFALLAVPVGGFAAVRLAAFVAAESDRRLTLLLAQPLSRVRLVLTEAAVTAGGMAVLVTVAGLAMWGGVSIAGGGLSLGAALHGTWNTMPVASLSLGAAVLATGVAPRAVTAIGVLPTAGGFLLLTLADSIGAPAWVGELSPFAHLAPVPLAGVDAVGALVMTAVTGTLIAAGAVAYRRRDLRA